MPPTATAPRATATRRGTQDILKMLKQDHKDVKALFEQFENTGPRAVQQRAKLATKITDALTTHSEIEKQLLYPAFKERAKDHDELQEVLEAFEEHAIVDRLVSEIRDTQPSDETYEAKVKTLMDVVLHHVKEEEGEMFKSVKELFDEDELAELGERAEAMR